VSTVCTRIWIAWIALLGLTLVSAARADSLFHWVDDKGVHHFTNIPPPEDAEALRRIEEIPYNAAADEERRERDLEFERQRELEAVQEQLEDAERQAEEASRRAEEAERRADRLAEEVRLKAQAAEETRYSVTYPYWWYRPPHDRYPWKPRPDQRPRRPGKDGRADYPYRPYPLPEPRK
jgi:hypothetical protein